VEGQRRGRGPAARRVPAAPLCGSTRATSKPRAQRGGCALEARMVVGGRAEKRSRAARWRRPSGAGAGASQHRGRSADLKRCAACLGDLAEARRPAGAEAGSCAAHDRSISPCRSSSPPPPPASTRARAGEPRLQQSRTPASAAQTSKSWGWRRARRSPRGRSRRGHPSECPGRPSGASGAPECASTSARFMRFRTTACAEDDAGV
jgi:hypothetical protein